MKQTDIDFVLRHYRRGALSAKQAWRQLDIPAPQPKWLGVFRGRRAAAAACVAAVLTASAFLGYRFVYGGRQAAAPTTAAPAAAPAGTQPQPRLEFTDVPLAEVVATVERTYGVTVSGLGADSNLRLTLSYQGDADELLEAINQLLGTSLKVEK